MPPPSALPPPPPLPTPPRPSPPPPHEPATHEAIRPGIPFLSWTGQPSCIFDIFCHTALHSLPCCCTARRLKGTICLCGSISSNKPDQLHPIHPCKTDVFDASSVEKMQTHERTCAGCSQQRTPSQGDNADTQAATTTACSRLAARSPGLRSAAARRPAPLSPPAAPPRCGPEPPAPPRRPADVAGNDHGLPPGMCAAAWLRAPALIPEAHGLEAHP